MVVLAAPRPFQRLRDGIQFRLRLDDWPGDLPLPAGSAIVGIGNNHEDLVYPTWRIVLEPEGTIEVVGGWFIIPLLLESAVDWYKTELSKQGWIEQPERGFVRSDWAVLHLCHSEKNAKIRLSIRRWDDLNETRVIIERGIKHPWPETPPVEAEQPLPREAEVSVAA